MASIPLPALSIQQPPSVLEQYGKVMQLRNLGLQQQQFQQQESLFPGQQQLQQEQIKGAQQSNEMGAADIKLKNIQVKDQQLLSELYPQFTKKTSTNGSPTAPDTGPVGYDFEGLKQAYIKGGGSMAGLTQINGIQSQNAELTTKLAGADEATRKNQQSINSAMNDAIETLQAIPDLQARKQALPGILGNLQKLGVDTSKLSQVDPSDENLAKAQATLGMHQQVIEDATKLADLQKAQQAVEPGSPLGDKVSQLNQGLTSRYQVLNPDKPLPPQFTLPPNATQKDFDRVDKLMEATERGAATKAQQDTANSFRQQTLDLAKSKEKEIEQTKGITPVIGTDPNTGRSVLVSQSEAEKLGLNAPMKAGEQEVSKAQAARHWIQLADKSGDTPETMGITQLIDKMDKEGKLGVVASRWNEFMAGTVGAGDPEFTALRTKMGLSTTLLMNAHVGSRGGSYMLEHFEDLASAKKMNAQTLRSGLLSELDYVKDRAMLPPKQSGGTSQAGMVNMKAPDGTIKPIPADQVEHYKSKGATIVP